MKNKWLKNLSAFEFIAILLIAVLIVATVVTAIVIANKKQQIDEMNRKNEEISSNEAAFFSKLDSRLQEKYISQIEKSV